MSAVITDAEVHIPLDELVDFAAELERLTKEKKKLEGEVKRGEKMLLKRRIRQQSACGQDPGRKRQACELQRHALQSRRASCDSAEQDIKM